MKIFYNNDIVDNIETCIINHKYDIALSIALKYIEDYPKDSLGPIYLARCKELNNDKENVIEECEKIVNSKLHNISSYVIAYTWYGMILNDMHMTEKAIEKFKKAISYEELDKNQISLKARMKLANIYIENNETDKAIKLLENIETNNYIALSNKLAFAYIISEKYNEAFNELKKIDDSYFPDNNTKQKVFINKGKVYHHQNQIEEAIKYFKKALFIKNKIYNQAIKELAYIYSSQSKYDEAIKYGLMLLETKDYTFDAYVILGKMYLKKGMINEASYYINNLKDGEIKDYYLALLEYTRGNFEKSKNIGEHLLNNTKDDKTSLVLTQVIYNYIRLNKIEEAYYIFKNVKEDLDKPTTEQFIAFFYNHYNKELTDNLMFYSAKQIYNYNTELAIDHIYDHHFSKNNESLFSNKESIKILLEEAKEKIKSLTPKYEYFFNKYIYSKENISDKENDNDILVVITLLNSNDIITMYPLNGDIIYSIDEVKEIKRESQIDKFYRKYGKK